MTAWIYLDLNLSKKIRKSDKWSPCHVQKDQFRAKNTKSAKIGLLNAWKHLVNEKVKILIERFWEKENANYRPLKNRVAQLTRYYDALFWKHF